MNDQQILASLRFQTEEPHRGYTMGKVLGTGFVILIILVTTAYFLMGTDPEQLDANVHSPAAEPRPILRPEERREIPAPPAEVINTYQLSGDLPALDDSDDALFKHLSMLLSRVRLGLLKEEQFLRKLVLQIDNAAQGRLVYQHSPLVGPEHFLSIEEREERLFIDKDSYQRYKPYGNLASSIDTSLLVAFYRFYEPLLDEAYAELGYPEGSFRGTLVTAIDLALATPVVDGDIELEQPEANYVYANESLESLNMLQKQLLRMGPGNTQQIQSALLAFKVRIQ